MKEEIFDLVNEQDIVIGKIRRQDAHGNPQFIHRVSHVLVFNSKNELFLQKRSVRKDVQPGKWDTSVGGHVDAGEDYIHAAARETEEELGISGAKLVRLYQYLHRNNYESEYVTTFKTVWDGPILIQESEIDEGKFWSLAEIRKSTGKNIFTPNFLHEFQLYREKTGSHTDS